MNCLFVLTVVLLSNVLSMDPELQLCADLTIDAAVVADDNIGYAIKGDFYWIIDVRKGINKNTTAGYLSDRWPGLTGPIDAAFTVDEAIVRLGTVFLKGNQYFFYKKSELKKNGTTENWPYRPTIADSAFEYFDPTVNRKDYNIIIFYDKHKYTAYKFYNLDTPTFNRSGTAWIKGYTLYWLYDPNDSDGASALDSLVEPNAIIADDKNFTIFGDRKYCTANIREDQGPDCRPVISGKAEVSQFYGCPRNPFPTTRLTPTTTTIISDTLVQNVSASENNTTDESTVGKNFEETIPEDIDPLTTLAPFDISPDYALLNGKQTTTSSPKGSGKPWILWIVLIFVICLITAFSLLFAVWRQNKSKNKKNEKSLQNKDKEIVENSSAVNEKSNSEKSVPDVRPTKSDSDSSKVEEKSSDGIPLYANSSLKTPSVRSEISESEESLGTSMKKTNSSLTTKSSEEATSQLSVKSAPVKEADEMLDAIKSSEDIQ